MELNLGWVNSFESPPFPNPFICLEIKWIELDSKAKISSNLYLHWIKFIRVGNLYLGFSGYSFNQKTILIVTIIAFIIVLKLLSLFFPHSTSFLLHPGQFRWTLYLSNNWVHLCQIHHPTLYNSSFSFLV